MYLPLIPLFFFTSLSLAVLAPSSPTSTPFSFLRLNFTFHGGPASYNLDFPADGNNHPTGSPFSAENLQVSLIDTDGHDAYDFCNFFGPGYQWVTGLVRAPLQGGEGEGLAIGPPQVITSVTCANWPGTGSECLPEYSECFLLVG